MREMEGVTAEEQRSQHDKIKREFNTITSTIMALKWNDSNRAYLTILLLFLGYYYRNFYIALLIDVVICFYSERRI